MNMTPVTVFLGATLIVLTVIFANAILPPQIFRPQPSPNARPYTQLELEGRQIYLENGCLYCHSQSTRPMDWGMGSGLASVPGDYAYDSPHLIGSSRNGPDLMHEGGYHPNDWHWAHFQDPRYVRPQSFMPSFSYITGHDRVALIAYIQCLGGKAGVKRAQEQADQKQRLIGYYQLGAAQNVSKLNSVISQNWIMMSENDGEGEVEPVAQPANGLHVIEPVTKASVERGRDVYVAYCIGCHGENGDGRGSARPYLNPPPMDFTLLQASAANPATAQKGYAYNYKNNQVSLLGNGTIYEVVVFGIPGSAMPQFKGQLESEKIWDVGDYVGWAFMGWKMQMNDNSGQYNELAERGIRRHGGGFPAPTTTLAQCPSLPGAAQSLAAATPMALSAAG